jgi:hypothetical protein
MKSLSVHFVAVGVLGALVAASGQASTIGNPAVLGTTIDTCNGCTFVLLDPFPSSDSGFNVISFSLFAQQAGNEITPLLFSESGGNYTVSGVGATETILSTGPQTFSFVLSAGSSLVGTSTFFGYRDGTVSTGNQGTIAFTDNPPATGSQIRYFGSAGAGTSPNIYLGEFFNSAGGTTVAGGPEPGGLAYTSLQLPRTYSLAATDSPSAVPEPQTISFMLGGAVILWIGRRRRA